MKKKELSTRVATGVVGGGGLLALIIWGSSWGSWLLACVIGLGMTLEYSGLCFRMTDKRLKKRVQLLAYFALVFGIYFGLFLPDSAMIGGFVSLFLLYLLLAKNIPQTRFLEHFSEFAFAFCGLIYVGFLPLYLPWLRELDGGMHWVIVFFLIVWAGDTGAYFVGRTWGRKKLFESVSPKKTVEGAAASFGASLLVAVVYWILVLSQQGELLGVSWIEIFLTTIAVSAAAQAGDLCESLVKRAFGVKDSGRILPGHGGFLDRFDGVVIALPVMYTCLMLSQAF